MAQYKMRFYKKFGMCKGDLDHEEFFSDVDEMYKRYDEVFVYNDFALNPTMWVKPMSSVDWVRIVQC